MTQKVLLFIELILQNTKQRQNAFENYRHRNPDNILELSCISGLSAAKVTVLNLFMSMFPS